MSAPSDSSAQPRASLTRERVLRAAIGLADEGGFESLTMRTLGKVLGVEAMSLYNHVTNKDDILDGIVDLVVGEIELPAEPDHWEAAIRTCAISAHEVLLRHHWVCGRMMSPRTIRPTRMRYIDWMLSRLREGGFSAETIYHAYHALDSHILGFTFWELGHMAGADEGPDFGPTFLKELPIGVYPDFAEHIKQHLAGSGLADEGEFEFGLELILDGLKRIRDAA